jgi:hypothetical protein
MTKKDNAYQERLKKAMNKIKKDNQEEANDNSHTDTKQDDNSSGNTSIVPTNETDELTKKQVDDMSEIVSESVTEVDLDITTNEGNENDKQDDVGKQDTVASIESSIKSFDEENEKKQKPQGENDDTGKNGTEGNSGNESNKVDKGEEGTKNELPEGKEVMVVHTLKELQENNFQGISLTDIISCYANEIEQQIMNTGSEKQTLDFEEGVALKWEDTHPKKSYPATEEIHQIIDIITKRTPLRKYQVFERLILNGLKYTKFPK